MSLKCCCNKLDPNFEWFKFPDHCCGILHILGSNGLSNGTRDIQQGTVSALDDGDDVELNWIDDNGDDVEPVEAWDGEKGDCVEEKIPPD